MPKLVETIFFYARKFYLNQQLEEYFHKYLHRGIFRVVKPTNYP